MRTATILIFCALGLASVLAQNTAWAQTAATTDFGPDIEEADSLRISLRVAEAEEAYRRALAKSPNDPTVLVRYASFRRTLGHYEEAIELLRRAEESIANGHVLIGGPEYLQLTFGITYYRTGLNYGEAAAIFRQLIEDYPDAAAYRLHLAFSEIGLGNEAEARRNLQLAERLFGDSLDSYRASTLALGYAQLGLRQDVMRLFGRLEAMGTVSQAAWAAGYIALADYEEALERLDASIRNPEAIAGATNVLYFLADNIFDDPVLEGPRFQDFFNRLRGRS